MDAHSLPPDDLNEVERRLSAWQPSAAGISPDAMLFAAGRASARGGKAWLAWPVVSGCLALTTVALGVWLAAERSERLALLRALERRPPEPAPAAVETPASEPPAPDSYLTLRRQWEQHPGDGAIRPGPGQTPRHQAAPEVPILRAWQPKGPVDPL
jgi:hypothetical protein